MRSGAVAVFVKTPGLSRVKTRLAATVGLERAERFYSLCVAAVEAVVRHATETAGLIAYWAVAEPQCLDDPRWRSFRRVLQGTGELGQRLDRVYRTLLDRHAFVLLAGADAPLLSTGLLLRAATVVRIEGAPFAISRSSDGGYSLFAGRIPLPSDVWTTVPYSSTDTAASFLAQLAPHGAVAELTPIDDVDTFDDLAKLVADSAGRSLLPEQIAVVDDARALIASVE